VPGKDQADARLSVQVTATKAGYNPLTRKTAPTAPVLAPNIKLAAPGKITGKMRVGQILRANPGAVEPADATATYQWLRDGKEIPGATRDRYRLKGPDIGKSINVRVSLKRFGYLDRTYQLAARSGILAPLKAKVRVVRRGTNAAVVIIDMASPGELRLTRPVLVQVGKSRKFVKLDRKGHAWVLIKGVKPGGKRPYVISYPGSDRTEKSVIRGSLNMPAVAKGKKKR
jgi:hypothetical protein